MYNVHVCNSCHFPITRLCITNRFMISTSYISKLAIAKCGLNENNHCSYGRLCILRHGGTQVPSLCAMRFCIKELVASDNEHY